MSPNAGPGVVPATDSLATLKRFDPDAEQVLASSGHVCLYTMAVESQQWTRKDVEGSLFLLKRRGTPRFRMMVLNKLSTENYVEDIHGGLDFELNPPYLMYTHGNSEIIGVWFYEQDDLHRVEDILKRIKASQGSQPAPAAASQAPARAPGAAKGDDESFWDKPGPSAAPAQSHPALQPMHHAAPAAPPRASTSAIPVSHVDNGGSSNLATLLRNAHLKHEQQQQQVSDPPLLPSVPSAPLPQPLPPSFFAQQRPLAASAQPAPATPPQQGQAQVLLPEPPGTLATASSFPAAQRISQVLEAPRAAPDQQPAGGQMGGQLAKLFANAHKAAQPVANQSTTPLPPQPAAPAVVLQAGSPPAQLPPVVAAPVVAVPVPAPAPAGVPDEERVRRLLTRLATNDAFLKILASEMRAIGML